MNPTLEDLRSARNLLRSQNSGVLSTISQSIEGYPFGSVVPYALDQLGQPVVLISSIAEHYKNIMEDPRVSIIVLPGNDDDVQSNGRVTVIGKMQEVREDEEMAETYFRYFEHARDYQGTHNFSFFKLRIEGVRYIGGFGKIFWMEPDDFLNTNPFFGNKGAGMIDHMNADHEDAIRNYCKHYKGLEPKEVDAVKMTGIDTEGFDVALNKKHLRFTFDTPISSPKEAREMLVKMAKEAK